MGESYKCRHCGEELQEVKVAGYTAWICVNLVCKHKTWSTLSHEEQAYIFETEKGKGVL